LNDPTAVRAAPVITISAAMTVSVGELMPGFRALPC
jgi:hypothetical protein